MLTRTHPDTQEDTSVATNEVGGEGRFFPVTEADSPLSWNSSKINDEAEENETSEDNDLEE